MSVSVTKLNAILNAPATNAAQRARQTKLVACRAVDSLNPCRARTKNRAVDTDRPR